MKVQKIRVPPQEADRLDRFLAHQLPDYSRTQIQRAIEQGRVTVDDRQQKASYRLQGDEVVAFEPPEIITEPEYITPQPIPLPILYEDEALIVLNKPAGLPVHPGKGNPHGTLVNGLVYYFRELSDINGPLRPGIVHRLDQNTSGLLLVAKNNRVHHQLSEQFAQRVVEKTYVGITWGQWPEQSGSIEAPIGRCRGDPTRYEVVPTGRSAKTGYEIQQGGRYLSVVHFFPRTGRTHQIRVHCAYAGHPLFGDEKYGGGLSRCKGFLPLVSRKLNELMAILQRQALHAYKLRFFHPVEQKSVTFTAPIADDMQQVIQALTTLHE
ncbi:MAG: RluA family pseudouridine synthase [Fidelibacterota bacterium]